MLYGWKENSMLTNCLAACVHLTITITEIERDIGRKSSVFHTTLHSTPPLVGFPSEWRHPVWCGKTRMAWLPEVKKFRRYLYSFWRNSRMWQTDGQTEGQTDRHRMRQKWRHFQSWYTEFSFYGRILKTLQGENDGYS